ncbi:MAG TPA: adenylate/guanylate cyclase domain-containing protein [Candidatus Binatia bacterium]|nr:adenylate/guanylate cyclase domain-containing protein [Candidatus Binatia bacterium]
MAICSVCGEENPDRARFCSSCGTALVSEPAPARREERKFVTVLFCDLVGFTARSDNVDPEDVRATLRPYHASLRKDLERYGGTVEKFIGDAVMAVFGAPVAHEDDAERAVRAALRIIDSIEELNEQHPGFDLSVRIGVNTGEAVVALDARPQEGEGMVTGDVVNTAARLEAAAPVGGIVVGEVTYRATKDLISYEPLDPVTAKGKAQPIQIWRALEARSRYGIDVEQGTRTPFVGRANEFALLTQAFARAVDEGSVQLVTITGEPGVGKTRLLWEFRAHVDDRPELIYWRQGRCLPYGEGVTYWALGEMVKAQAGVLETDPPEEALAKLDTALAAVTRDEADRDWLRGRLAPLVGVEVREGQQDDRDEAFAAWLRFIEWIAARGPLVLVFEDLHWADGPLVEFVEHLVEWSSGVPLFVVCSARPELYERHPGWGGGKRNSTTVALAPLSDADTARLLSALLEQAVLPAELQAELLERAGGNPLYAEEFVRMLLDRGLLERHGASLRLLPGAEGMPLPESVHALIGARLDTLPAARKALLLDASVVGKVFWSGALEAMGGGVDGRTVREGLHDLAREEFVRTVRTTSVQDQGEYSFWHALVRDVAYGQIPRAERAAKHLAVAGWIERTVGERVADQAEFLAYHYERAIDLISAAGRDPGDELRGKASRALQMAAERAMRLDVAKAVEFYGRAETLLNPDDPELPELHVRTLAAAAILGGTPESEMEAAYERAIEHLRSRGETLRAGAMLREFSGYLKGVGRTGLSERLGIEAIELLEPLGPTPELVAAYSNRAGNAMMGGRFEEWKTWTDASLVLSDELDLPEQRIRGLQFRGIYRVISGDLDGRADLEEALRIGLERGFGRDTALAYDNLGDWISALDGPAAGLRIYQEGMRFADRRGLGSWGTWMRAETTWRLFDVGEWDAVLAASDEVRRWFGSRGSGQPLLIAGTTEARVRALRGELDRAAELMDELLPAARESKDVQAYRPALGTASLIALERGRCEEAMSLLNELGGELDQAKENRAYSLLEAMLLARALGDLQQVDRFGIRPSDPRLAYPVAAAVALAVEAERAEAHGNHEEALRRFVEAEETWSALGHVFHRGLALLGQARCLSALGRPAKAEGPAREAEVIFAGLRARSLAGQARALLPGASTLSS